jgi:hypothetical protein
MAFKTKIWLTILVVFGFDAIASILSKGFQFDYTRLRWVSFAIYLAAGYWGAHHRGFTYGMALGSLAGFVDSTIGWFVSRMIGPFTLTRIPSLSPVVVVLTIVTVTASALVFGLIGAGLCKIFGQTRSTKDPA